MTRNREKQRGKTLPELAMEFRMSATGATETTEEWRVATRVALVAAVRDWDFRSTLHNPLCARFDNAVRELVLAALAEEGTYPLEVAPEKVI